MATFADPKHRLSRLLSRVLRHQAISLGMPMANDGYVQIDDLLKHNLFKSYNIDNIIYVVANNGKKRFEVNSLTHPMKIRAVQGHSIDIIDENLLLQEINDPDSIPICIHGTYDRFLDVIMISGLNRMGRTHIHMASGLPHDIMSGARKDVDVLVYINVAMAMHDGIRFYRSRNDVILSAGVDYSGIIPSQYFEKVVPYMKPSSKVAHHRQEKDFLGT